jgi:acyl-coenzyme A thioesterase PaaI-like protein
MSDDDELMTPWPDADAAAEEDWDQRAPAPRGGVEFAALHNAQRLVQDRLAGAAVPPALAKELTEQLLDICGLLAAHQVPEPDRYDGWRPDLPGRGHPLLPPYVIDDETEATLSGRVTFTRFYLGGNGAAHGGAHPLLFDDVLGRVMNHHQPGVSRTAYLTVNYRRVTPLDVELRFEASRDSVEGRKRWGSARLFDASGALLSDAEGLFLQLLPGQP